MGLSWWKIAESLIDERLSRQARFLQSRISASSVKLPITPFFSKARGYWVSRAA